MPETDTLERPKTLKVQVANLSSGEHGTGFARLPVKIMQALSLNEGDVVEIIGKRSTTARVLRPYDEDEGLDLIRLDGLQRSNARVGSGDFVEVRKAQSKPATRIVFAPAQDASSPGSEPVAHRTWQRHRARAVQADERSRPQRRRRHRNHRQTVHDSACRRAIWRG